MGNAYKITPPPTGSKARFGLLKMGGFKSYESFRRAILAKGIDGMFAFEGVGKKHFLTIKAGKVVDEEARDYGDTVTKRIKDNAANKPSGTVEGEPAAKDENAP